jgi:hypothetical protein
LSSFADRLLDGDAQADDLVARTRAIEDVMEVVDLLKRR